MSAAECGELIRQLVLSLMAEGAVVAVDACGVPKCSRPESSSNCMGCELSQAVVVQVDAQQTCGKQTGANSMQPQKHHHHGMILSYDRFQHLSDR